ncbi:MAG: metallophosphoesterase family protein [Bacillota bacterium]
MKIAVFADVHGNLYSLEAVLKDIESKGIDRVYCVGDLVGYGPRPNEVVQLIRSKRIPTVMGNYDDAIGNMRLICGCDYKDEEFLRLGQKSIAWTGENTGDENKAWLSGLPSEIRETFNGHRVLFVHGSPGALNEYLYENTSEEYLDQLLKENSADILVCGHTHLPYVKKLASGLVVNAGSAGKPKHGNPNATYVIIDLTGDAPDSEIIEVEYDYEATAAEIEKSGLPSEFARIVRTGKIKNAP